MVPIGFFVALAINNSYCLRNKSSYQASFVGQLFKEYLSSVAALISMSVRSVLVRSILFVNPKFHLNGQIRNVFIVLLSLRV